MSSLSERGFGSATPSAAGALAATQLGPLQTEIAGLKGDLATNKCAPYPYPITTDAFFKSAIECEISQSKVAERTSNAQLAQSKAQYAGDRNAPIPKDALDALTAAKDASAKACDMRNWTRDDD
jgi:hypothetical protein